MAHDGQSVIRLVRAELDESPIPRGIGPRETGETCPECKAPTVYSSGGGTKCSREDCGWWFCW